ncbi:hypothetical protein [Candidatus Poriferisodalis sp.]|uniref:hypothetical protein n=1 Tax=Candidatus Poriferisodalis sp. TaxID=3101277 RepID=UPI003B0298C0
MNAAASAQAGVGSGHVTCWGRDDLGQITPPDSRPALAGHQVDLTGGRPVTVTSTHPYNDTERTYPVIVPRPDAALSELSVRAGRRP